MRMLKKFPRSAHVGAKGHTNPPGVVCDAPAWCRFNALARELAARVTSQRGMATSRPDAWEVYPAPEEGRLYLIPGPKTKDNFTYQWSRSNRRAWVNLFEVFDALQINLRPGQPETFGVAMENHPELGWALVIQLSDRHLTTPEELIGVQEPEDEAAAAELPPESPGA